MTTDQRDSLVVARAQASERSFNKVFGIGCHKTGTTSLFRIFRICGLKVGDQIRGQLTSYDARRGRYEGLVEHCRTADAFQDSPFAQGRVYAALDAFFPDSRFILTVRDPDDWFRSLQSFTAWRHGGRVTRETLEADTHLYPGYVAETHAFTYLLDPPSYRAGERAEPVVRWDRLFDRDHYISVYERRNQEIRDHFKGRPHQLLEIDLTREATIDKITEFLGLASDLGGTPMPHFNRTKAS